MQMHSNRHCILTPQVCRWEFLVFSGKFPMELTVAESAEQRAITFSLASSPFMHSFQGTWQVRGRLGRR